MHLSKTTLGPCYPQGTLQCIPKPGDFSCQCRYGFDGRFCEQRRDFCAEAELREGRSVCLNGGQCLNHRKGIDDQPSPVKAEESFICQCPAGFSGPRCEIRTPSCDNVSLCQNGGVCTVEGTRLKCDCPHGLGGTFCEVDLVDECARAGNCLNGGRCIDGHGNYTCECLPDFCGRRCELSGFACAIEATTDPNRWPGEAAEARLCEIAECQMKAGNGRCDPECDRFACGFDAGECLYSMQFLTDPVSVHDAKLTMALPWANCTAIHQEGFPCHLRFGDGKCDPTCDSASCLFDGWDCMHDSIDANLPSRTFARTKGKVEWEERSKSPPEPVEGSLILLLGVPPSELLPEDNKKRGLERQFLEGLGRLLRVQLRIRQLPNTGAPMVYPVKIMTQTTTPRAQPRKDNFWSLLDPTVAAGGMNVSVNQLIIDQGQTHNLEQVIALLTTGAHKPEILHRRRREAQEVKLGSRVFLEVQDGSCQKSGSCIHNVETAAQFVSAALRTRRYTPPVDILSIETASPETLQQLMSDGSYSGGRRSIFDHLGLHGTLVYCLIGLICSLVLLSLFGVLYGIMQRRVQGQDIEPGSGYGQKNLMKKIKTTSIWYPRNSGSREGSRHQHHHHSAVFGGFPTAACAEGGTGTPSLATQARARAMVTPHSSHLPFWSRERALAAAGEKLALRASAYPAPQPLPPTPSTTAGYSQACTTANADSSVISFSTTLLPNCCYQCDKRLLSVLFEAGPQRRNFVNYTTTDRTSSDGLLSVVPGGREGLLHKSHGKPGHRRRSHRVIQ
uniref:Delta-like protein n=1 Tax=Mesocestoides corti TaxID=53468 RepID=A0A5K3F242_MESCO